MSSGTVGSAAGRVVEDRVIPAGEPWARVLKQGQTLRIIDLEGRQAVDFLCYNAKNPEERYNAADTMKYAKTIFLTLGHGIYSDAGRRLLTIVEDTCGRHDTIGGCCSAESNELRYGVKDTPSCRANFLRALAAFGLGKKDVVANLNFFMNVPVEPDGAMAIVDGVSKPGDYVDLRAEMDVLAVISNCPQTRNPCNGFNPTPIRLIVREPALTA
jgi:urea carboxylase-associated protein 1